MGKEQQFSKCQQTIFAVVAIFCLTTFLLLYGIGAHDRNPLLQGLGMMICMVCPMWVMAFLHGEAQFTWRWRTQVAIAVGVIGFLLGWIASTLLYNSFLVATGLVISIAPMFLFRMIERWNTTLLKKQQTTI